MSIRTHRSSLTGYNGPLVTFSANDFDTLSNDTKFGDINEEESANGPEAFDPKQVVNTLTQAILMKAQKDSDDAVKNAAKKVRRESLKQNLVGLSSSNPFASSTSNPFGSSDAQEKNPFASVGSSTYPPEKRRSVSEDFGHKQQMAKRESKSMRILSTPPKTSHKSLQQAPAPFDPELFRASFEQTIHQLLELRGEMDEQISTMIEETEEADRLHKRNLNKLSHQLNNIYDKFRSLDQNISTVSHTAVRIGGTLENVDTLKSLDEKGRLLLSHLLKFNEGPVHIPRMYPTKYRERERKDDESDSEELYVNDATRLEQLSVAAPLIQQLYMICEDAQLSQLATARDLITRVGEDIEAQFIVEFEKAIEKRQIQTMRKCALMLLDFPGRRVIQRYHNSFRILSKPLWNEMRAVDTATRNNKSEQFRQNVNKLFKELLAVCTKEAAIMVQVFPNAVEVYQIILERLFEENLSGFVEDSCSPPVLPAAPQALESWTDEDVLNERIKHASKLSKLLEKHLVCIKITFSHTKDFVNQLLSLAAKFPMPRSPANFREEHTRMPAKLLLTGDANDSNTPTTLNSGLEAHDVLNGLFANYRQGYVNREKEHLRHLYYAEIVGKLQLLQYDVTRGSSGALGMEQKDMFGRRTKESKELTLKYVERAVASKIVNRLLDSSAAAVRRASSFIEGDAQSSCIQQLFALLFNQLMDNYFQMLVDKAIELVSLANANDKDDNSVAYSFYLALVKCVTDQMNLVQIHYARLIVPRISNDSNVYTIWDSRMRSRREAFQTRVQEGIQICLQAILKDIGKLLARQKPTYYKPADAMDLEDRNEVTQEVIRAVKQHVELASTSLGGGNKASYTRVFGLRLFDAIATHFKKFKVNSLGGMLLLQDAKAYEGMVTAIGAKSAVAKFSSLRILSNVLLPLSDDEKQAAAVKSIRSMFFGELKLNSMDISEVHDWIRMRADYGQIRADLVKQIPQLAAVAGKHFTDSLRVNNRSLGNR